MIARDKLVKATTMIGEGSETISHVILQLSGSIGIVYTTLRRFSRVQRQARAFPYDDGIFLVLQISSKDKWLTGIIQCDCGDAQDLSFTSTTRSVGDMVQGGLMHEAHVAGANLRLRGGLKLKERLRIFWMAKKVRRTFFETLLYSACRWT
jgi:hypothetical protein